MRSRADILALAAVRIGAGAIVAATVVSAPIVAAAIVPARAAGPSAAAASSPTGAQAGEGEALAAALKEARTLIDQGRARDAIQKLEPLAVAGDPRVRHLLGVARYHADDYQPAVDLLQGVHDQLRADSLARRETEQVLGFSLHLLGRYADAIPWLERTRVHTPDHLELNFVLGQAYVQTRQPGPARDAFARTFGVPPASAAAYVVTAKQMIRLQMEPMAEEALRTAIKVDPKAPQAHYLLGQLALFRGRFDEAVALSARELAIDPADAMALYQMGDAYTRLSRWDDGIRVLQQSLWLNPFYSGPYILLGRAYMKKGQPATAEGMLRRALEYDPNNRAAHYLLAQLLQQTGREDEATREFAIAERLQGQAGRP